MFYLSALLQIICLTLVFGSLFLCNCFAPRRNLGFVHASVLLIFSCSNATLYRFVFLNSLLHFVNVSDPRLCFLAFFRPLSKTSVLEMRCSGSKSSVGSTQPGLAEGTMSLDGAFFETCFFSWLNNAAFV